MKTYCNNVNKMIDCEKCNNKGCDKFENIKNIYDKKKIKAQGIYMTRNIQNPKQLIPQMKDKPLKFDNKVVGKILSAKLDKDGNLVYEAYIEDEKIKKDLSKNFNYSLKILGEE